MPFNNFILIYCFASIFFTQVYLLCQPDEYTCPSDGQCIRSEYVCDGAQDCLLSEDENREGKCLNNVTGVEKCINSMFTCSRSLASNLKPLCVPLHARCDGFSDCFFGEDELGCSGSSVNPCNSTRNMFRCNNGKCIPRSMQCDVLSDCPSKVDEINCSYPLCTTETFKCSYGLCIRMNKTCDGIWDCRDGSDETAEMCDQVKACENRTHMFCSGNAVGKKCVKMSEFCSGTADCSSTKYTRSMCNISNCNCGANGKCVSYLIGYDCNCTSGYERNFTTGNPTCTDINECKNLTICDQACINTVGSFRCACANGFDVNPNNSRYCLRRDTSTEPILFFANRFRLRRISLNGTDYKDIDSSFTFINVLDFDFSTRSIFYNEYNDSMIKVLKLTTYVTSTIKYEYSNHIEGIALDWIARKLYWTSSVHTGIYVSEIDGSNTAVLIATNSLNTRGIALVPSKGYIFWTDWGDSPFIGRSGMDGKTSINKIVHSNIFWPNGITVDYMGGKVYWVDAFKNSIELCDYDGGMRMILVASNDEIPHPFGITVFDNYVFWSDWNKRSIMKADKLTGKDIKVLIGDLLQTPFDLKIVHPSRQPSGTNPCAVSNGGCSHLCLISEGGKNASCACPIGYKMQLNNRTCLRPCDSASQFKCAGSNDMCISWYKICNGVNNCPQGDDEPATCKTRVCGQSNFQCNNALNVSLNGTKCVLASFLCDGKPDCSDGSDENMTICRSRVCDVGYFLCPGTGQCIPQAWVCDEDNDCKYGEDETQAICKKDQCSKDQFKCDNNKCIDSEWFCDFDNDCGDHSDEPNTCWRYRSTHPCLVGFRQCPFNYRCIWNDSFCDKHDDCRDNSDEQNCSTSCRQTEFSCADSKICLPLQWRCDYTRDCLDGSDETNATCVFEKCRANEFTCANYKCIQNSSVCDGFNNCGDMSDETNCKKNCSSNFFQCPEGTCIWIGLKCDGQSNCLNGTDELNCPTFSPITTCPPSKFRCLNGYCVNNMYVCDGQKDCLDNSDEAETTCQLFSCNDNEFHCKRVNRCIPLSKVCDGVWDCNFGADEDINRCQGSCKSTEFQCNNGTCIPERFQCNLFQDCPNGEDENICTEPSCNLCEQNCTTATTPSGNFLGYRCNCNRPGTTRDPMDRRKCIEIDECGSLELNLCSQYCVKYPSFYKCKCADTFTDIYRNGSTCISKQGFKGTILYSAYISLQLFNLTSELEAQIISHGSTFIDAIEFDSKNGVIYNARGTKVYRSLVPQKTGDKANQQKIVDLNITGLMDSPAIAIDWTTQNLYISDADGLKVVHENVGWMPYYLLNAKKIQGEINSLALLPALGKLYFTSISGGQANISVIQMSGIGDVKKLISQNLIYPASLVIDYNMISYKSSSTQILRFGRMFWVNRHIGSVESANLDGTNRILLQTGNLKMYALDVFNGKLYLATNPPSNYVITSDARSSPQIENGTNSQSQVRLIKMAQKDKYGPLGATSGCNLPTSTVCTFCLSISDVEFKCVCPESISFIRGSNSTCNMTIVKTPMTMCHCENGGSCVTDSFSEQFTCACPDTYAGEHCEISLIASTTIVKSSSSLQSTTVITTYSTTTTNILPINSSTSDSAFASTISTKPIITISPSPEISTTKMVNFGDQGRSTGLDSNGVLGLTLGLILGCVLLIGLIIIGLFYCKKSEIGPFRNPYSRHDDTLSEHSEVPSSPTSPSVLYKPDLAELTIRNDELAEIYANVVKNYPPAPNLPVGGNSQA